MSTTGRNGTTAPAASDVAAALDDAGFVRLLARPDGDAVAATGVLASVLSATGTPFQASVADPYDPVCVETKADYTVAVGDLDVAADATLTDEVAASAAAFDVAGELAAHSTDAANDDGDRLAPDPVLALAGTIAADEVVPPVVEAAEASGVERRPGLSVPVTDLGDGLAHSTLFSAPFSGDVDETAAALAKLDLPDDGPAAFDEDDWRRVASLVALEASSTPGGTERAAEAVERALRPFVGGPFETVGGYADVLDAAVRVKPGVALSLVLGHDGLCEQALAAWRDHAVAVHTAIADGETARHDGLSVVLARDMPVATVARLAAEFRSAEPVTLAVADGEAAIHAIDDTDAAAALAAAVAVVDGVATGTGHRGRARFTIEDDMDDWTTTGHEVVDAVREAL